jgi:hypothetical protein
VALGVSLSGYYACWAYQKLLAKHGMLCSMSRKGNFWDCEYVSVVRWA